MSIDMILDMAESQTQGIKNLVTRQNEAYTELQKSLAEFILQTDKLKGVTYDSAKKILCSSNRTISKRMYTTK